MEADERFTDEQLKILVTLERTGGSVSLIGVVLIFLAYGMVRRVRNVQNTFIVFASVSNVGASIASIIALDGIHEGKETALCQAQSFLFEMFMQSDPWWSLAMAINVFLVFYFRASPESFQKWWWLYCLICYGGPFTIAITLLLIREPGRPPVYGGATIWCWVDNSWDSIRIYTYYMLIWVCIGGSIVLYFLVGYHVFRSRNRLRSFSTSKSREAGQSGSPQPDLPSVPQDGGFYGTVVTEVQVVHTKARHGGFPAEPKRTHARRPTHVSFDDPSSSENQSASSHYFSSVTSSNHKLSQPQAESKPPSLYARMRSSMSSAANKFVIEDHIKRAYLRTSLLFGVSVLVTWIPSSMNRIHGWLDGRSPYEFHVAAAAVLPLQGLWNAVIFFVTSWRGLKDAFDGHDHEEDRHRECTECMAERGTDRAAIRQDSGEDSELDYADSGREGSDVELNQLSKERSLSV